VSAKIVTDETFEADVLSGPRPVIVEYWAQWCGPCRMVGPVLEAIAEEHTGEVDVVRLNVDEIPRRHSATASCTSRPWTCSVAARWSSR
jgi:thioredoxin 1